MNWEKQKNEEEIESPKTPDKNELNNYNFVNKSESPDTMSLICDELDALDGINNITTPLKNKFNKHSNINDFDSELKFSLENSILEDFKNFLKQLNSKVKSNNLLINQKN
jgi:hypothetical protein